MATPGEEAWRAAMALVGHDDARAERDLEALVQRLPRDPFADEALIQAAELREERLADPQGALALYQRLIRDYPQSRHTLRARARTDYLSASLRTGAAPLVEYQEILRGFASRPEAESAARMERLLAQHPDFALADQARLWLARGDLTAGRWGRAVDRYDEAARRSSSPERQREAKKGRADALLAGGHPLRARTAYRELVGAGDVATAEAARAGIAATTSAIAGATAFAGALLYLGLFAALSAREAGRALLRVPIELKFYLPVAALFAIAAATENRAVALATLAFAVGGAVIIWLGGAATARRLERGPLSKAARLARAAATALAVAALIFAALHAFRLGDFVLETLRAGPDR